MATSKVVIYGAIAANVAIERQIRERYPQIRRIYIEARSALNQPQSPLLADLDAVG